ncbi:hypothetical protein [Paenibacillus ginsengarvi]|uniref:Uncharacterized protein n=1 Tax=Paenibacillus ginsengarvi TaxID=400777 RepID=A0A3B0CML4_9BACL|nr:hypothetical protein [Paenibacillus ginsengarvi]RKN85754.1 hypothetical protein D7M11_05275 [Paenibacillus ginsengarvi]
MSEKDENERWDGQDRSGLSRRTLLASLGIAGVSLAAGSMVQAKGVDGILHAAEQLGQGKLPFVTRDMDDPETMDSLVAGLLDNASSETRASLKKALGAELPEIPVASFAHLKVGNDWAPAIEAAIASLPAASGPSGQSGGVIRLPSGRVEISRMIVMEKAIILQGAGAFTTTIVPSTAFSGPALFRWKRDPSVILAPGAFARDLNVEMINIPAIAFHGLGLYDNILFENVRVVGVHGSVNAFRFEPNPEVTMKVSQTLTLINTYARSNDGTGAAPLYYLEHCQEVVLINAKALGSYGGGGTVIGTRSGYELVDCRGIAFYGCSFAFVTDGLKIRAATRDVTGVFVHDSTVESCNRWLNTSGTGTFRVRELRVDKPRVEGGAGGALIGQTESATIEYEPLTFGADVSRVKHPRAEKVFIPASMFSPNVGSPVLSKWDFSYAAGHVFPAAGTTGVTAILPIPTYWSNYKLIAVWTATSGTVAGTKAAIRIQHDWAQAGNKQYVTGPMGVVYADAPSSDYTQVRTVLSSGNATSSESFRAVRIQREGDDAGDTLPSPVSFQGLIIEREF